VAKRQLRLTVTVHVEAQAGAVVVLENRGEAIDNLVFAAAMTEMS
jgi:hypothetical protein